MSSEIMVGLGSCGIAAGAQEVYGFLSRALPAQNLDARLGITGCMGACHREVLVEVRSGDSRWIYADVTEERAQGILERHIRDGAPVEEWLLFHGDQGEQERRFFDKQRRMVLRNCGVIDPESLEDYMRVGGYQALTQVLRSMSPEEVIGIISASGLRGRGGAGFPTGLKWKFTRAAAAGPKYLICNADEGDPGAFMDRSVLESDPHSVLEGMIIAAYAVGANEAFIYVRAEYPLAIKRLQHAIRQAREQGWIGPDILGSGFSFEVKIKEGAGAFVCGEETALMASLEGRRGMPRIRPPFPAQSGLWGKPTNINNVETFANVPWIVLNGPQAFAAHGTDKSKGSKVFALAGKIKCGGLVEVPMGITINEVIYDIGGGTPDGIPVKAVQMGGPSGGCIPAELFNTRIDYDEVTHTGAIMGSGGMVVMDAGTCMVDVARFFLNFTQNESCGKCTFCRIGTKRMLEILIRITEGAGTMEDLTLLPELAHRVKSTSLCGLGQTAPNPVLTTLKYFKDEYLAHILEKRCPAGYCKALLTFTIHPELCVGCGACKRVCPAQAVEGEARQLHTILQNRCIKCGSCFEACKFKAVVKE